MLYQIEVINQSLLAAYTLHVQETMGAASAQVVDNLCRVIEYVNRFDSTACFANEHLEIKEDIVDYLRDALDSLKSLSEILGEKHRLVSTAALAIGAAQDPDFDGITLGYGRYFSIEVDENNNVVSVANGNTKVPFTLEYRLSKYGRWDAQLTWLSTVAEMRSGDVCLSDIADLLCEPDGPELLFKSYKAAEQIMEMLEPFEAKALEPLSKLS